MKFMIASDIHGSAFWCRKMLEAFDREHADRLLFWAISCIMARAMIFQMNTLRKR